MKDWGTYALLDAYQIAHYPSQFGNSGSAFLLVGGWKADGVKRSYQVLFSQKGIARRDFINSWSDWQIVYDTTLLTNSTMLGQLANALGVTLEMYKWQQIPSGADVPIDDNQLIVTFKMPNSNQNWGKISFGDSGRVYIKADNQYGSGTWKTIG